MPGPLRLGSTFHLQKSKGQSQKAGKEKVSHDKDCTRGHAGIKKGGVTQMAALSKPRSPSLLKEVDSSSYTLKLLAGM